eukprot:6197252-Prymnesium_polylepis.3
MVADDPPKLFTATDDEPTASSGLRQRRTAKKEKDDERISTILSAAATAAPPAMTAYIQNAAPAINYMVQLLAAIGPFYAKAAEVCVALYHSLPMDVIELLMGLGMCFFGGTYCASIAAVEAFMLVGWDTTSAALAEIYDDALAIKAASDRDDDKQQQPPPGAASGSSDAATSAADHLKHKAKVAALAVRDPEKLSRAVGGVYAGWVVVQGTLRLQARRP